MKTLSTIFNILVGLFISCQTLTAQDVWTKKADFGGAPRRDAFAFSIGSLGYVGGGLDSSFSRRNDFWVFNPAANVWTPKTNVGGPIREGAICFSIGGKGYVGLGTSNTAYLADFWQYDPDSNKWTPKASFPGTPRRKAVSFSIANKGFVGTGYYAGNVLNDFWEYNPDSNKWTQRASFPGPPRQFAASFSIGRKGYIGTGTDTVFTSTSYMNDFWEYNMDSDQWTQKADVGVITRCGTIGFSIGTKGYMGMGVNWNLGRLNDLWEYDPSTNGWTQKTSINGYAGHAAIGFSISNKGYVGTGENNNLDFTKDFYEYSLTTGIPETNVRNRVQIYPNPTHGQFKIISSARIMNVEVYDITGKQAAKYSFTEMDLQNNINLPLSAGLYYLRMTSTEGTYVDRLVVE